MAPYKIWLRHETKAKEQRVTLTPEGCAKLIAAGYEVTVERSPTRIIPDSQYEAIDGVKMAETNAWRTLEHDPNLLIVGLKELGAPEEHVSVLASTGGAIVNAHTYFAHCYKGQEGYEQVLEAYRKGNGKGLLFDYEFLWNQNKQNVGAAMSPFAGFVGCAQGIRAWSWQVLHEADNVSSLPPIVPSTKAKLVEELKDQINAVVSMGKSKPRVMVMGALGRCGTGARECAHSCGLETIDWDLEETKNGGPFPEILKADIFVNCILLQAETAPFLTLDMIDDPNLQATRKLRVIADVSCDPNSQYNPIPVYNHITSWEEPAMRVRDGKRGGSVLPLEVISVDNLPSVLAEEASYAFGETLLPLLMDYPKCSCWNDSAKIFQEKVADLRDVVSDLVEE
jgi:saccharopine dehydrogenase (NAD+, L-lysine forming)